MKKILNNIILTLNDLKFISKWFLLKKNNLIIIIFIKFTIIVVSCLNYYSRNIDCN